ncbi:MULTISPECIES: hypothetical protein [unclassified Streptomyces]|uniref:hypothetical protein n=1 Tax=unclassified Streptomyces TaxID=2593676 RepID=UPI00341A85C4
MLRAGNMLYVPRCWWHAVAATEGRFLHLFGTPAVPVAELLVCAQAFQAADRTPFYATLADSVRSYLQALASRQLPAA